MAYERCGAGITCRGIRRAFRDELNSNPILVGRIERAVGHRGVASFEGAFMTNQGTDLRMIIVTANGAEDEIHLNVEIDAGSRDARMIDLGSKPAVRVWRKGDHRHLTVAPRIWFHDRSNAAEAENMLVFEDLLKLASPAFSDALEQGIARADRTFEARMKPKAKIPVWAFRR